MAMPRCLVLLSYRLILLLVDSCICAQKPNIVVLITDDQDIELGSMEFMPKTLRLLRQRGTEFRNAFVSTPICCPSRSSILSGVYAHNHNVMTNNGNCAGQEWRGNWENGTFAVRLQQHGYRTAFFGKYLNEYDGSWVPPGWNEWSALVRNSRYYNYSLNRNGEIRWHGDQYESDYLTDLVANMSLRFIETTVSDLFAKRTPFLAVLSFPAPHGPEDPAPQFAAQFEGVETHRTAAWNYAPNPDKQWLLRRTGKMEPVHVVFTDQVHRRRLQTLQSVDDAVHRLVQSLRWLGQLHNTVLLFTSDHGYHLGQFGLLKGKAMPYEFDIRVPFFLRGPDIPRGKTVHSIVSNIDIAPTILALAGISEDQQMDGRSVLRLLNDEFAQNNGNSSARGDTWRETVLIERGKMPKLKRIRDRLEQQKGRLNREGRIARECTKPKYQVPCAVDMASTVQWQCVRNAMGKWRLHKCDRAERKKAGGRCRCGRARVKRGGDRSDEDDEGEGEDELETEFLRELEEREVVESGQWYQGMFGWEESGREAEGGEGAQRPRRQLAAASSELWSRGVQTAEALCAANKLRFCHRLANTSSTAPYRRLQVRIAALRRKLSAFKHIRKALNSTDECKCDANRRASRHPLRNRPRRMRLQSASAGEPASCHIAQMNCFLHSHDHWRTPPLWPRDYGQFCFCQNANNNSYWCLRTVNTTHNFLYCEFVTEEVSFYDLNQDPYQLTNTVHEQSELVLEQLSAQLRLLKSCKGRAQCDHFGSAQWATPTGRERRTQSDSDS